MKSSAPVNEERSRLGDRSALRSHPLRSDSGARKDPSLDGAIPVPNPSEITTFDQFPERLATLAERSIGTCPSLPLEIDGYRLVRFLGSGTHGEVWLAEELGFSRLVAIKFLDNSARAGVRTRMLREARVLASLNHPAMMRIFGSGFNAKSAWLILEYCPGGSLAARMASGMSISPVEAANMLEPLAHGIHLAHTQGIIHRDIKPENILFGDNGKPRLADFGLAKIYDGSISLTGTGEVLGTPAYIAPEQVRGERVGPSADIHALGGVLYHILAGFAPFRADSAVQALAMAESQIPLSPLKINPGLPVDLVNICLKCLEKDPRDRYATALDLADDLQAFIRGTKVRARPLGRRMRLLRWSEKNKMIATSILVAAASLIGGTVASTQMAYRAMAGEEKAKMATGLANLATIQTKKQFYNSEMRLIQNLVDDGFISQARRNLHSLANSCGDADFRNFEWFYWDRKLKPGPEECYLGVSNIREIRATPTGELLLTDDHHDLHLYSCKVGGSRVIANADGSKFAALDPLGTHVLLTDANGKGELLDGLDGGANCPGRPVGPMAESISRLLVLPHGMQAIVVPPVNKGPILLWDLRLNKAVRELGPVPNINSGQPRVDPKGERVAFMLRDKRILVVDCQGGSHLESIPIPMVQMRDIAWDPAGKTLVGVGVDEKGQGLVFRWAPCPGSDPGMIQFPDSRNPMTVAITADGMTAVIDDRGGAHFFDKKLVRVHHVEGKGNLPKAIWVNRNQIGVADETGGAKEFDSPAPVKTPAPFTSAHLSDLAWLTSDKVLVTGYSGRAEIRTAPFDKGVPLGIEFDPGETVSCDASHRGLIVVGGGSRLVRLDKEGKILGETTVSGSIRALKIGGRRLLVRKAKGPPDVYDAKTLELLCTIPEVGVHASISRDGEWVAMADKDEHIKIFRAENGAWRETIYPMEPNPVRVVFGPNGMLYIGFQSGLIQTYDMANHIMKVLAFRGHQNAVGTMDVSLDGKRLVSAGQDFTIRVWDTELGQPLLNLISQPISSKRVRFSPDGNRLASVALREGLDVFDGSPVADLP